MVYKIIPWGPKYQYSGGEDLSKLGVNWILLAMKLIRAISKKNVCSKFEINQEKITANIERADT